jgi:hypothetical protein
MRKRVFKLCGLIGSPPPFYIQPRSAAQVSHRFGICKASSEKQRNDPAAK